MRGVYIKSVILLFMGVGVSALCYLLPSAKVSNETGVVLNLPEYLESYDSELIEMSDEEKFWLPKTTRYIKRSYLPIGEVPQYYNIINFSLIVSGGDDRSLHRPEVCLDGQGWSIPSKTTKKILYAGKEIEITDLHLKRVNNGQTIEAHYYFFWVGRGISTPSYADMKWLSLWDNFTKNLNHRWAYPGLFVAVNPQVNNPHEDAWNRAQLVMKGALPFFHKEFGAKEALSE